MVSEILSILRSSADESTYPEGQISLAEYLNLPTPCSTFFEARNKFANYMRLYYNSEVPTTMSCVPQVGTETINNWCRSNASHGFEPNSLRLPEKLKQSKVEQVLSETSVNKQLELNQQ